MKIKLPQCSFPNFGHQNKGRKNEKKKGQREKIYLVLMVIINIEGKSSTRLQNINNNSVTVKWTDHYHQPYTKDGKISVI